MTSLPRFSVNNPILVGVTMAAILIGGVHGAFTLVREMFPEFRPNLVGVSTLYPGASPEEIEKGLALRLEEAIKEVDHIEKIQTTINEGNCMIAVEMTDDVDDIDQAVTDVKAAIDAIPRDQFPDEAEETRVAKVEPVLPVISVIVFGEAGEHALKEYGQDLRDELLALPGITEVTLSGYRKAELTVEIQPEKLIEYELSLSAIADAIRQSNIDLPGGQVKTSDQNISVRTLGETDQAGAIAETIVRTRPGGDVVRVRDLGRVIDGFEDSDVAGRFNGLPAVDLTIQKTGDQDAIDIATKIKAFVAGKMGHEMEWDWGTRLRNALNVKTPAQRIYDRARNAPLPPGVRIATHSNLAKFIEGRLELLQRNGACGLVLVFGSLLLFLNWRVAIWVLMGLILSVAGAIMLMGLVGATLNLISMFGLIVVLGIIVDDAIVVGENIFSRFERGDDPHEAAVAGAEQVSWPVTIAVLTTIAAFVPLMFIEGLIGDFMGILPVVVMCALSVSLIEALAILPSHLAESLKKVKRHPIGSPAVQDMPAGVLGRLRARVRTALTITLPNVYGRLLIRATAYRYVTVAVAAAALIVSVGMVAGERVPFVYLQKMESETLMVNLEMPVGTPAELTSVALEEVEQAVLQLQAGELLSVYTIVGGQLTFEGGGGAIALRSHLGQCIVELTDIEDRERTSEDIIAELRERTRDVAGANSLRFEPMQGGPGGAAIEIEISGQALEGILACTNALKAGLAGYDGVFDVDDNHDAGRREVRIELLDSARPLNVTTRALATEVRGAFYGLEARTIQRRHEDVDIRVRFPAERRRHLYELESMRIATPAGNMIPLGEIARIVDTRGYSAIRRIDQRRAVTITADVDQTRNNAEKIIAELGPLVAELERAHPGVRVEFAGNKRETTKSLGSLRRDFLIALLIIYVMLCGLFKSYTQPVIVMTAVPFGLTGAIMGHYIMGYPMTILSMIGIVALTGIVVNDSLILVDFINHEIKSGREVREAVIAGGRRRLRPILLTSLTTILGLAPLMAEQSFQARFLIPMAISISFGLAFATLLTLVVVPSIYLIYQDFKGIIARIWAKPELLALPE